MRYPILYHLVQYLRRYYGYYDIFRIYNVINHQFDICSKNSQNKAIPMKKCYTPFIEANFLVFLLYNKFNWIYYWGYKYHNCHFLLSNNMCRIPTESLVVGLEAIPHTHGFIYYTYHKSGRNLNQ